MSRALKVLSFVISLILIVAVVVLLPYKARSVPEWRVQVVDENEGPVPGAQANRVFGYTPSAHIFVCWQEKAGDVFWKENNQQLTPRLVLRTGPCPYG